ncbi:hypothetical protein IJG71_02485 [Candidatus Saccharibacteria bacterium]|nr:hypothetical protein [Candidatus Saccharibacteria bacterium]
MKRFTKIFILMIAICGLFMNSAHAEEVNGSVFSLAPMNQMITLTPGETYQGNFQIVNPGSNQHEFYYTLEVQPFTTADDNSISFIAKDNYSQIVDWIQLSETSGVVDPNESREVRFTVQVPEAAPAGGQYATIVVRSGEYAVENSSVNLNEVYKVSHLIYADVAGETVRKGSVNDVNIPSFLFSGNIAGSALIKNEGNVHSQATSTLQVFPLFSSEEVFTNEEDPKKSWIMPGNTTLTTTEWTETPSIGIVHVIYNVEFEGVSEKVDKMVIVCPLWLLFIIAVIIFLIIFKILSGKKKN